MDFTVKFYPVDAKKVMKEGTELDFQTDVPSGIDPNVRAWLGFHDVIYRIAATVSGLGILDYELKLTYKDRKGALRHARGQMYAVDGKEREFEFVSNIPDASPKYYVLAHFHARVH